MYSRTGYAQQISSLTENKVCYDSRKVDNYFSTPIRVVLFSPIFTGETIGTFIFFSSLIPYSRNSSYALLFYDAIQSGWENRSISSNLIERSRQREIFLTINITVKRGEILFLTRKKYRLTISTQTSIPPYEKRTKKRNSSRFSDKF